ncbi:MAG: hypothetical protein V7K98_00220 [Nostoc sp.]|uniref:hypothetical protein n=1 Tax=Nostoc sp. TaxID=1180 RepID=UPI002FFA050A
MALQVDVLALQVDVLALQVDALALQVDALALQVDALALQVDALALQVGWVEALRNPTNSVRCWVSFLNPTYAVFGWMGKIRLVQKFSKLF